MGSRTVAVHVLKGIAGLALLSMAFVYGERLGWWTLIPIAIALALFRG